MVSLSYDYLSSKQEPIFKTIREFTQASSIHGLKVCETCIRFTLKKSKHRFSIQYITEAGANLMASRVFWLILVLAAAGIGIHWSLEVVGEVGQIYQSPDYVACLI